MANNFLDTKTVTLDELLGNGKRYKVPLFQRDYSWDKDKWEDLFFDISELNQSAYPHFMGAIVLQTSDGKVYDIIDGQQRIASLTIFIISIIQLIKNLALKGNDADNNNERAKSLIRKYLGDKNPASLMMQPKIELNQTNNDFFHRYIAQFEEPSRAVLSKQDNSNKLLYQAHKYFYDKIESKLGSQNGEDIARYLESVADKVKFIQIAVEDELNAYTLFETLNARGVELSSTDLLKNYLFSKVSSSDLGVLQSEWNQITQTVSTKDFPNYLRYYVNSKSSLVRKNTLYKELRKTITNGQEVFALVENLKELSIVYTALQSPTDDIWKNNYGNYKELKNRLSELELFKVTQQIPLLLSAYQKLDEKDFIEVIKICSIISFRYIVIGRLNPNDMERAYNKCAIKVFKGEVSTARDIFGELKSIYVDDDEFENSFSFATIDTRRNKKLAKYILISIENQISAQAYDFETNEATIEHILPENPIDTWKDNFSDDEIEKYTYRLGNYTLLESEKNKALGNKHFKEKLPVYQSSAYLLSNSINYDEWSSRTLQANQEQMAKKAKTIWKISYATNH